MTENKLNVWSDFDGTAVELVNRLNPRHYTTYPLAIIDGYKNFLHGIREGGGEVAGIVSARADRSYRRWATVSSITKLGLTEFFRDQSKQMFLAGNEQRKADFIITQARRETIGFVDDRPHCIGTSLLNNLVLSQDKAASSQVKILLGMTKHSKSDEYQERYFEEVNKLSNYSTSIESSSEALTIRGESFVISSVALSSYSTDTGKDFSYLLREFDEESVAG